MFTDFDGNPAQCARSRSHNSYRFEFVTVGRRAAVSVMADNDIISYDTNVFIRVLFYEGRAGETTKDQRALRYCSRDVLARPASQYSFAVDDFPPLLTSAMIPIVARDIKLHLEILLFLGILDRYVVCTFIYTHRVSCFNSRNKPPKLRDRSAIRFVAGKTETDPEKRTEFDE